MERNPSNNWRNLSSCPIATFQSPELPKMHSIRNWSAISTLIGNLYVHSPFPFSPRNLLSFAFFPLSHIPCFHSESIFWFALCPLIRNRYFDRQSVLWFPILNLIHNLWPYSKCLLWLSTLLWLRSMLWFTLFASTCNLCFDSRPVFSFACFDLIQSIYFDLYSLAPLTIFTLIHILYVDSRSPIGPRKRSEKETQRGREVDREEGEGSWICQRVILFRSKQMKVIQAFIVRSLNLKLARRGLPRWKHWFHSVAVLVSLCNDRIIVSYRKEKEEK
jgi:hypothetical protein